MYVCVCVFVCMHVCSVLSAKHVCVLCARTHVCVSVCACMHKHVHAGTCMYTKHDRMYASLPNVSMNAGDNTLLRPPLSYHWSAQSPLAADYRAKSPPTLDMAPFSLQSCRPYRLVKMRSSSFKGPNLVCNNNKEPYTIYISAGTSLIQLIT